LSEGLSLRDEGGLRILHGVSRWLPRVAAVLALVLVGLGVYAIVEPVALFGYDDKALKRSLRDEADSSGPAECTPRGEHWLGYLSDGGSGIDAAYRLEADADGCWTATPVAIGKSPVDARQPELAGCVDLTDIIL
jgi:hypothetical protein